MSINLFDYLEEPGAVELLSTFPLEGAGLDTLEELSEFNRGEISKLLVQGRTVGVYGMEQSDKEGEKILNVLTRRGLSIRAHLDDQLYSTVYRLSKLFEKWSYELRHQYVTGQLGVDPDDEVMQEHRRIAFGIPKDVHELEIAENESSNDGILSDDNIED